MADIPMSIRLWDDHESGIEGFASIREAGIVQSIIPVISPKPSIRTYTSQETGIVHALYWLLKLADETALWISSMRADQKNICFWWPVFNMKDMSKSQVLSRAF